MDNYFFFTIEGAISKWRFSEWIPSSFSDQDVRPLNEGGKKLLNRRANNETMKHDSGSGANGKTVPSISAEGIQTL